MKITRKKIYSASVIAVISFCIFFTFFPKSGNINPVAKPFSTINSAINSEKKLSFRSAKAAPAMENVYSDMATSNSKMVAASFNDSVAGNSIYAEEAIEHFEKGTKNGESKKLIKTGNVSLEVNSLSETVSSIENWVKSFGGYISNKNEDSRSIYICAHIPSGKFDEAFNQAGSF